MNVMCSVMNFDERRTRHLSSSERKSKSRDAVTREHGDAVMKRHEDAAIKQSGVEQVFVFLRVSASPCHRVS